MKIIGVSFFWGIAATIMLSVTLFSIAIYDTAYHRIHNIIKYLFFILYSYRNITDNFQFTIYSDRWDGYFIGFKGYRYLL